MNGLLDLGAISEGHGAAAFLYHEARLLDDRRFAEWFDLFESDGHYWVPLDEHADPRRTSSIIYDDHTFLEMRVYQLQQSSHFTQNPPSQTLRFVTNVEVDSQETAANNCDVIIRANVALAEIRSGAGDWRQEGIGNMRWFAARCEYHLRERSDHSMGIVLKKSVLLGRERPFENLTFLI
ncbi:MAG: aromatic-ring-hydroxylating dioxygenase subunit beta [Phycisphaerales bacterium]